MSQNDTPIETWTLVDGHVHIHDSDTVARLLDSALGNFEQATIGLGRSQHWRMLLLLTETSSAHEFRRLRASALHDTDESVFGHWRISTAEERCSLNAVHSSGKVISIVAGRQIVTREMLEVLALCTDAEFPDREPIESTLERAASSGAVVALPWGFGKWTGRRGEIVRHLLENDEAPVFHLGDNSGRLKYWPEPREFSIAKERGLHVLPGTDPLPFPPETSRVGRFGFALPVPISIKTPASDLVSRLSDPEIRPIPYGRCEGLFRFLKNQVNMQLIKHGPRKTPEALPRDPGAS